MKKILSILFITLMLTSCGQKETLNSTIPSEPTPIPTPTETPYIDENPIIVGLYQDGKLVHTIDVNITNWTDIAVFEVCYSNEENLGANSTKYNFNKCASNYENVDKYKIGFQLSFETTEKKVNATFTKPEIFATSPYIYNYLYDDVHEPDGAWYSHLEDTDVKDNTIYSSIKLFAAEKPGEITSPIALTVFTYDTEDDFDEEGNYRGKSKYTITINRK